MASIRFYHINHQYVGFQGDRDVIYELKSLYSFYAPNYKWDKRYKMGYWDGKISLINTKDSRFLAGLLPEIRDYLDKEGISYIDETNLVRGRDITFDDVESFYDRIKGPFVPHESQNVAFQKCVTEGRNIVLAPTSNGKSYIIHGLNAYYKLMNKRVLIIIDRATLVLQLKSNFEDEYGAKEFYTTSTIYDDNNDTDVVITTWQSIVDKPTSWFKQFDVIIGDEVHKFKAKSLLSIMEHCSHIEYRHGFTGTLDNDSKTDAKTLQGLFGTPYQTITLQEQIDAGISARPVVYAVVIRYPLKDRKELIDIIAKEKKEAAINGKKVTEALGFQMESKYLEEHEGRNALICKLATLQKGNTLVAFKNASHGKNLFKLISESTDLETFFANGSVSKEKRFDIQKRITKLKSSIAIVSFGTFSTGVNIPNLNNLIIGSQVKSQITVPQLIGRMIRLVEGKKTTNIIDICDDLSHNGNKNVFLRHFETRLKFYMKNGFEIKTKVITL